METDEIFSDGDPWYHTNLIFSEMIAINFIQFQFE